MKVRLSSGKERIIFAGGPKTVGKVKVYDFENNVMSE